MKDALKYHKNGSLMLIRYTIFVCNLFLYESKIWPCLMQYWSLKNISAVLPDVAIVYIGVCLSRVFIIPLS